MGGMLRRYPILIALAILAALLAVLIAWEVTARVGSGDPLGARTVRRAAPFEAKLLPPLTVVQADQQYPELAARPLWTPTRRPAPAAAAPSTYTPGQFVLQGVIVVGNSRTAMLREKANGKLHRVEAGKQLNGITVAEIAPDSVTLSQGADREVVPLQVQKPGAPGAPGAPGTPGAPAVPQATFGPAPPPNAMPQPAPHVPAPMPAGSAAGPFPSANPGAAPGAPGAPASSPVPIPEAAALAGQGATANPLSAEELLARRRARRGQQTQ